VVLLFLAEDALAGYMDSDLAGLLVHLEAHNDIFLQWTIKEKMKEQYGMWRVAKLFCGTAFFSF
jgi:hypothetical protein